MKKFLLLLATVMMTVAVAFSQTVLEEGFEGAVPPDGWTVSEGSLWQSSSLSWSAYDYNPHSGSYSATAPYDSEGGDSYLITPQLTIPAATVLSFWVKDAYPSYSQYTTFTVEVSTTDPDPESFTTLQTIQWTGNSDYFEVSINLFDYAGQSIYIAFHVVDMDGTSVYLDDVLVESVTCPKPSDFEVSAVTTSSATVSWGNVNEALTYTLQYKSMNDEEWTTLDEPVSETTYTFEDLEPATQYFVRVKSNCEGDDESNYAQEFSFVTECVVLQTLPYYTDFESALLGGSSSYPLPICWNRTTETFPYAYGYDYYAYQGDNSLMWGYNAEAIAVLPQFNTETYPLNTVQVSFYAKNSYLNGTLTVGVITDPSDTSTFVPLYTIPSLSTSYMLYTIALSNYDGEDEGYVAIKGVSPSDYIYLDNLTLEQIPECAVPSLLSQEFSEDETTFSLSWSTNADNVILHIKNANDAAYTDIENPELNAEGVYEFQDFQFSSAYMWYVSAVCGDETLDSYVCTFTTPCKPFSTFPITWSFDAGNFGGTNSEPLPICWDRITVGGSTYYSYPYVYTGYGVNSTNALYFYNYYPQCVAILGAVDEDVNINTLQLSFMARTSSLSYGENQIEVGVMTDPTVPSSFEVVGTADEMLTSFGYYEINFSTYQGEGKYIAIRNKVEAGQSSNYSSTYVDDVTLEQIPGCQRPENLSATNATLDGVTLTWTSEDAASFAVYYRPMGGNYQQELTNDNTLELTDLTSGTNYEWYVVSVCEDGTVPQSQPATFSTLCNATIEADELPYSVDFEGSVIGDVPNCWTRVEYYTYGSNVYPRVINNSSNAHSGTKVLHFYPYCDNDQNNSIALPAVNEEIHDLRVTFWAKPGYNEDYYGRLEVGLMSDLTDLSTFELVETYYAEDFSDDYEKFSVPFANTTMEGNGKYVVFRCFNDWQYSWYLDDVVLEYTPDCIAPYGLAVSNISPESANLTWNSTVEQIELYYKKSSNQTYQLVEDVELDENGVYVLENLEPATLYDWYVKAICEDEELSSNVNTFSTDCLPWNTIPYTWSFESGNDNSNYPLPECWNRLSGNYPYVYVDTWGDGTANSGTKSLQFSYGATNEIVVLPNIDVEENPINTLQVSFYALTYYGYNGSLSVGAMTDPTDATTFQTIATVTVGGDFEKYELPLNSYNGEGTYIALKGNISSDYLFIDDLTLEELSECSTPISLTSIASNEEAVLSWSSTAENFTLYYKEVSEEDYTGFGVTLDEDGTYTLVNLEPNTTYSWYVAAVCTDTTIVSNTVLFTTPCFKYSSDALPYIMDFDSIQENSVPDCWTVLESYYDSWYNVTYPSVQYDDAAPSQTNSMEFYPYGSYGFKNIIAMPGFEEDIHQLRLSMYLAPGDNSSSYGTFEVGLMSDLNDLSTFEVVKTIKAEDLFNADYTRYIIPFNNTELEGDQKYVVFRCSNQYGYPWYLDDVVLEYIPDCEEPVDLSVVYTTTNNAILSWTSTADEFVVYYKPNYDSVYVSVEATLDEDANFVLENLEEGTVYDWYVTAVCGGNESGESNVFMFITECEGIATVPQTWDFEENNYAGTNDYPMPLCWNRLAGEYEYGTYPYVNYSNNLSFYMNAPKSYAILPLVNTDVLPMNTLMLKLNAYTSSTSTQNRLEVGVMTDPFDRTTFTLVETLNSFSTSPDDYYISFEDYDGEGEYIAIRTRDIATTYNDVYITEAILMNIPDCGMVENIEVTETTTSTATLTWTGDNEAGYVVKYKTLGSETWEYDTASTTTITLTGLTHSSNYTVEIEAVCEGTTIPVPSSFITLMIAEDLPYSTDFTTGGWALNNGTCSNYWTTGTPTGQTDPALFVTNNGSTATYSIGSTSTIIAEKVFNMTDADSVHIEFDVEVGGEVSYNAYDFLKVFVAPESVEYNSSTSLTDESATDYSENALDFSAYASQTGSGIYPYIIALTTSTVNVSVNVANPNANGAAKVVFLWRNDYTSGTAPGAIVRNFSISDVSTAPEVVDTLPTVVTNAASGVEQTVATLNGEITDEGNVTITALGFEWKSVENGTVATIAATGTTTFTASLTGLTTETEYTFRAFATTADTTVYGEWKNFTTLAEAVEPCNAPTNVTVTDFDRNNITVTWDANGATAWNLQYRAKGATTWSVGATNISTNSYTITGLEEATVYQIQVQAVCESGSSDWSAMLEQTTGINDLLKQSISLYPNPANDYVDVRVSDNDVKVSRLEVYDVYGKLLNEVEVLNNPTRINVSSLANGMYYVRVITESGVATKNFIKK